jgi:hypothetical protein
VNGYRGRVTEPRQAGSRVLRATALSTVAVVLALGAHLVSGGARPHGSTLLQSTVVLAVVMGLLAGRRRTTTGLLVGLGVSQLLLHQWFALATPGECAGHLATTYVPGVHLLPTSVLPWGALAQTARACATTGDTGATVIALALAAHALAALMTGVVVTRGEALIAAALGRALPHVPTATPVRPVARLAVAVRSSTAPTEGPVRHVRRRGPPAAACVA